VVKDWMPSILKHQFDIGQGQAGVSAALYTNIAAMLGVLAGGWLADRRMRRTGRGRIQIGVLGLCCIIPALFSVGNAGTLEIAVAFLMLFGLGYGFLSLKNPGSLILGCERMWWESWQTMRESDTGESRRDSASSMP
jgi:nitrate/nitrite transporter NarK